MYIYYLVMFFALMDVNIYKNSLTMKDLEYIGTFQTKVNIVRQTSVALITSHRYQYLTLPVFENFYNKQNN